MKVWFDITNTPQVHFLLSILNGLDDDNNEFMITSRDFSETLKLLEQKTVLPFDIIGSHHGGNMAKKAIGLLSRYFKTQRKVKGYDVSISCGSESAIWSSYLNRKKSIAFGDNDLAKQWTYGKFVSYAFFPKSIPLEILTKQGINKRKIYQYDGFKEHIYIADFSPDNDFLRSLPFDNYVVVRPENIKANYVKKSGAKTITPELLNKLSAQGENILYLPRYKIDHEYAKNIKNIYIPKGPISGLDACYYSNAVFTGAGTFAREAACLNVPSYSFFAGERLLAVDKDLVNQEKMFFSRDAKTLCDHFVNSTKHTADLTLAKNVKSDVMSKLKEVLSK